jgi:hypothetical protein
MQCAHVTGLIKFSENRVFSVSVNFKKKSKISAVTLKQFAKWQKVMPIQQSGHA